MISSYNELIGQNPRTEVLFGHDRAWVEYFQSGVTLMVENNVEAVCLSCIMGEGSVLLPTTTHGGIQRQGQLEFMARLVLGVEAEPTITMAFTTSEPVQAAAVVLAEEPICSVVSRDESEILCSWQR